MADNGTVVIEDVLLDVGNEGSVQSSEKFSNGESERRNQNPSLTNEVEVETVGTSQMVENGETTKPSCNTSTNTITEVTPVKVQSDDKTEEVTDQEKSSIPEENGLSSSSVEVTDIQDRLTDENNSNIDIEIQDDTVVEDNAIFTEENE